VEPKALKEHRLVSADAHFNEDSELLDAVLPGEQLRVATDENEINQVECLLGNHTSVPLFRIVEVVLEVQS